MFPDSDSLSESKFSFIFRWLKSVHWIILSWNTKWRFKRYLKQLSRIREGNIWWEKRVGFPAKMDSYHSEDMAAIYLRSKRSGRGKGEDLEDGTEVKSTNTPSTIDHQRFTMFNGINSADSNNRQKARKLLSKFMNDSPLHVYGIIDHPPPGDDWDTGSPWIDRLRVRLYIVQNLFDESYRQFIINGLAKRGVSKIQIQIDDSNRANGNGLQKWLDTPLDIVGDTGNGPEVFSCIAGCIKFPKVFEAIETDRDLGRWDIIQMSNPYLSRSCLVGPNFQLSSPANSSNPWSTDNLLEYCAEMDISDEIFSEDELQQILLPHFREEMLTQMDLLTLKGHCQRLEIPSVHSMGQLFFLGGRKSTRAEFERGQGIDRRAAMIYRLIQVGHPVMSWQWSHERFLEQIEEEEE